MADVLRRLAHNPWFWVIVVALAIRLATLGMYPLGDTTEARYAEIARKMVETGNWLTPQFDYGVPFWGKPPLSTWLRAVSFELFGVNEFAARLPSWFIALGILWLTFQLGRRERGTDVAWIAATLLTTSVLFYILAGAVLMDPLMTLGTTLSMLAFWRAMRGDGRMWGYLVFVGLAIGLMAKGPVAVVMTGLPLFFWLLFTGQWKTFWQHIPLISGSLLMLALAAPWYILAERATPGFLEYFFIGEHWKRFTEPGWQGDLYGNAHTSPKGKIWIEWLVAAFPLSFALITGLGILLWKQRRGAIRQLGDDWALYLLCWALSPMLFFTFSGNVLATYVFPGLPATALLVASWYRPDPARPERRRAIARFAFASALFPVFFLLVILFYLPKVWDRNSEVFLIEHLQQQDPQGTTRLYYLYRRPFSAEFYSRGKARLLKSPKQMREVITPGTPVYFAVEAPYVKGLPADLKACLDDMGRYGRYVLLRTTPSCPAAKTKSDQSQ